MPSSFAAKIVLILLVLTAAASAEDAASTPLAKYQTPRVITELEWKLMKLNLHWQGAYRGEVDYVTSFPVQFHEEDGFFTANFKVQENRFPKDPNPFFSLSKAKRTLIFQEVIDHLIDMISSSFPEVRTNPDLLRVEFKNRLQSSSFKPVALFSKGKLTVED